MLVDGVDHRPEERVEQVCDFLGRKTGGQLGRAREVDEHHGHLPFDAVDRLIPVDQQLHDVASDVAAEQVTQPLLPRGVRAPYG